MAAELSQELRDQLRIVEIEEEFLAQKPLSRPKKTWFLLVYVGLLVALAILSWIDGSPGIASGLLALALFQLVVYQSAKEANHLYDCGAEIIRHYRNRHASGESPDREL